MRARSELTRQVMLQALLRIRLVRVLGINALVYFPGMTATKRKKIDTCSDLSLSSGFVSPSLLAVSSGFGEFAAVEVADLAAASVGLLVPLLPSARSFINVF